MSLSYINTVADALPKTVPEEAFVKSKIIVSSVNPSATTSAFCVNEIVADVEPAGIVTVPALIVSKSSPAVAVLEEDTA